MKHAKKLMSLLLALVMVLSLTIPAFAADGDSDSPAASVTSGTITMDNATKGESYHLYKLFDVTFGEAYTDDEGNEVIPTAYVATSEQVEVLKNMTDNVFAFAEQSDGNYQVTVDTDTATGQPYTEQQVIDFINSFVRTLSGGVTACGFPGAVEEIGTGTTGIGTDKVATASTITWNGVPYGYYFVTSSLGAVVSLNTSNPNATITDKNTDDPDWNNEPDEPEPDGPVKDVLNEDNQSIDGDKVKVNDKLTYEISYTNESGAELDKVVITDKAPEGTTYQTGTAKAYRRQADSSLKEDTSATVNETSAETGGEITWTFSKVAADETIVVQFQVMVTETAKSNPDKTIVNDATTDVTIGEHEYNLVTNKVKNPVEDPDDPVKDVMKDDETESFDGQKTAVNDILTYKISYKNNDVNPLDSVVIKDAAPTGTVYVADSAGGVRDGTEGENAAVSVDANGNITWTFKNVAADETVTAYFKVKVTEAALSITDKTIVNTATVKVDNNPDIETNQVTNPVGEDPHDPNPGKVIVNADGSESTKSTGKFGDTVSFDIGINAVNLVQPEETDKPVQARAYYIYDQMDKGFTLKPETMKVTIAGTEYVVVEDTTVTNKANGVTVYAIQVEDGSKVGTLFTKVTDNGETLIEATIPWANVTTTGEGKDAVTTVTALYPNCKLHLSYDATINENAVIAADGNVNKVRYDYSTVDETEPHEPDPKDPKYPTDSDLNHGSDEKQTTTYTYALGIQKYSAETGEPLEGAIFTARDAGGNPIYAVPVEVGGKITHYNYTSDSSAEGATKDFVTNADGQIIIKGVDIGKYTFTEVKAPKGYNLLDKSYDVEAQMDSETVMRNTTNWTVERTFEAITEEEFEKYTGDVYIKSGEGENKTFTLAETKPEAWSNDLFKLTGTGTTETTETGSTTISFPVNIAKPIDVENHAGSLLPSTGGMGTTIFYVVGSILLIGAAVLLITKRRMRAAK